MSLTVLIHKKAPEVAIVRWFKDPKFSVAYPSGPLIRLNGEEFRAKGFELIKGYCEDYKRLRMEEKDAIPVFQPGDQRSFLKQYSPVSVFRDGNGVITLAPLRFRKFDLGGLTTLGPESFCRLTEESDADQFWKSFDAVLADAG